MKRKRLLLSLLLISALLFSLYRSLDLLKVNEGLKKAIQMKAASLSGGTLTIDKATLGFFSLHLRKVRYRDEAGGRTLFIKDIRVSLDPVKLFKSRFNLLKSISRIEIVRPQLRISSLKKKSSPADSAGNGPATAAAPVTAPDRTTAFEIPVDSLIIRKGAIFISDGRFDFLSVRDIQGHVILRGVMNRFTLSGKFLNAGKNMTIQGAVRSDFREFNCAVQLEQASLTEPVDLGSGAMLKSADIDVVLYFLKQQAGALSMESVAGTVAVRNGLIGLGSRMELSGINGLLKVENDTLFLDSLTGSAPGGRFLLAGLVRTGPEPGLHLSFSLPSLQLGRPVVKSLLGTADLRGALSIQAEASGRMDSLLITGRLAGEHARWGTVEFSEITWMSTLQNEALLLQQVRAKLLDGALEASGRVRMTGPFDAAVMVKADRINLLQFAGGKWSGRKSAFQVSGQFVRENGRPGYAFRLAGALPSFPNLGEIRGRLYSKDGRAALLLSCSGEALSLEGESDSLSPASPFRLKLTARDLTPSLFSANPAEPDRERLCLNGTARFSGRPGNISIESEASAKGFLADGTLHVSGTARFLPGRAVLALNGFSDRFTFLGIQGPLSFRISREGPATKVEGFRFARAISGDFSVSGETLLGTLAADRLNLSEVLDRESPWVARMRPEGVLNGKIEIRGSADSLEYKAGLELAGGSLGAVRPLSGKISVSGRNRTATISAFRLETPARQIISSEGLVLTGEGLIGRFRLDNLNLSELLGTESGISGTAFLDYKCDKPGKSELSGAVHGFKYGNIRLSHCKFAVLESQGTARISQFSAGNGNVSGEITGFFPHPLSGARRPGRDSLNLTVILKGDLLKQAAEMTSVLAPGTRGIGEVRLNFVGDSKDMVLENGYLDITKDTEASLRIRQIFSKEITGLKAYIGINRRVASVEIEAEVRNKKIRIVSEPGYERETNLVLDNYGVDFGVLKVLTPKGGIEARIPGFMHFGEYGEFELFDLNGSPGFLICGPLKAPRLIGKMRVNNARFTFPTIGGGGGNGFVGSLDWDATILAGNNLKYFYNHRKTAAIPFLDKVIRNDKLAQRIDQGISDILEYPFTELTLDKSSALTLHGSQDKRDFKLSGRITASRGYVHYAGMDYNQDLDVGVEFDKRDNVPIIWGSAMSLVRPMDRSKVGSEITLTLKVKDPSTGAFLPRGKFNEFRLVPSSDTPYDENGNPVDVYQEMLGGGTTNRDLGQTMGDLARSEGKAMFEKIFLQRMVTNYVERTVLGFGRENINPLLGMNVTPDVFRIEIESDKVFNYIDMSVWNFNQLKKDLLENIEFITGKYFFGGTLFLNYSSQFEMAQGMDNIEVERLRHRVGMEVTPMRYLYFNMDYEIGGIPRAIGGDFSSGDVRSNVRLKVPLKKVTDMFTGEKKKE